MYMYMCQKIGKHYCVNYMSIMCFCHSQKHFYTVFCGANS
jgi:hypothetical protein